ncbi:MAG: alpha/beta fold hydrolase [Nanoarchaeota archaeon]
MWEYIVGLLALLRAFQGIRFFLIKRRVRGPVPIVSEAKPFFKKVPGQKVALLLHGFTSSPKEFRDLSNYLAKNGMSSYAPLLPGHGTSPERLAVMSYYHWVESVEEQISMLAQDYNEIYLIGNSFGGNLALICAQYSPKIKGVVTLGTPMFFRRDKVRRFVFFPILRRIKLFQAKKYKTPFAKKLMTEKAWSYQSMPLRSLSQLLKLLSLTKKSLPKIKKPLLVMQVDKDHLVDPESSNYIISKSASKYKKIITIPESYHMFLIDKYAYLVHKEILDFIENKYKSL